MSDTVTQPKRRVTKMMVLAISLGVMALASILIWANIIAAQNHHTIDNYVRTNAITLTGQVAVHRNITKNAGSHTFNTPQQQIQVSIQTTATTFNITATSANDNYTAAYDSKTKKYTSSCLGLLCYIPH